MLPVQKLGYFGLSFLIGGDTITIDKNEIIYGVTDNFARYIAKYYLYTASRKEEFYFDAFLAFLTNKIKIEKHKSKSQS